MRPLDPLFDRLQAIFNVLAGVSAPTVLPAAFREAPTWEAQRDVLHLPAAWRRPRRVA